MAAGVKVHPLAKPVSPAQAPARVIHLYGLTEAPGSAPELVRGLKGVDGIAPVERLACAGLICWISRVSEVDFARNLSKNMQDLDWLAAVSVRHQRVISVIAEGANVLPARFGIEFLDEKSLRSHIQSRQAAFRADFDRIRGKEEWGMKVFTLPPSLRPKKKIRTGKEYLQAKSLLSRSTSDRANPELPDFARALKLIADDIADGGKFGAARRDLEFNKTLLLKRADRKKLESLVRRFSRKWKNKKRVVCTGPWPPFSFVSRGQSSG
jgi:hypothetical protein